MSHSPTAQLPQGTGSGWRTIPATRSPGARFPPASASITRPRDSWPSTRRSRPGGAQPYSPPMISRSVLQTPSASASTSTAPASSGGSGTSSSRALPCWPGTTVIARIALPLAGVGSTQDTTSRGPLCAREYPPGRAHVHEAPPALPRLEVNDVDTAEVSRPLPADRSAPAPDAGQPWRVAVLGPGGIGGLLAALLARDGDRVICIAPPAT